MIKKGFEDHIVYYEVGGSGYTVKLSEASAAQLKIIKGIYPDYFEKEKTEKV